MSDESFAKLLHKVQSVGDNQISDQASAHMDTINKYTDASGEDGYSRSEEPNDFNSELDSIKFDTMKLYLDDVYITSDQGVLLMDTIQDEFEKVNDLFGCLLTRVIIIAWVEGLCHILNLYTNFLF